MTDRIELLAPARDLNCGRAAIDCGADAVYIGAARFGARARAGNSLADIQALAEYAHRYWARVYAAVNTLLRDDELDEAVRLTHQLYAAGVDGLILQDVGLLEGELPPLPLIASTQMHNHTPERVAFLEQVGFKRAILARELSLEEIRRIRRQAGRIELEGFVHGALCVGYSGQCCLSYAIGGRSGNRGECAQPCRRPYDLVDRSGRKLVEDRHLLSLRDLNLSAHLDALLEAGITSFKIEGRLKDEEYIRNVVSFYRRRLDLALAARGARRSSSGQSQVDFEPDLNRTFNRGYTPYFLFGRKDSPGSIDTPKMTGQVLGRIIRMDGRAFVLDSGVPVQPGDGLCFFDRAGELRGTQVNAVQGERIFPDRGEGLQVGTMVFRNRDQGFVRQVRQSRAERRIAVRLELREGEEGFVLTAVDEDGNRVEERLRVDKVRAEKPEKAMATLRKQLGQMGGTEFACSGVEIHWEEAWFLPIAALNGWRRAVLEKLAAVRGQNRPVDRKKVVPNQVPFPETQLTYLGNALNQQAVAFYRRHGVVQIEPAAESGLDLRGRKVMTSRYCIKHQLGWCPRQGEAPELAEPLYLVDEGGHRYELRFDCQACQMEVYY